MSRFIVVFLSFLFTGATAQAAGCFLWSSPLVEIHQSRQWALLVHDEGVEELVMEVEFTGAGEEFVWLVALPAPPEIREVEEETFELLASATKHKDEAKYIRASTSAEQDPDADATAAVRKVVGVYDISVFDGDADGGLYDWLSENGFRLPDQAGAVIERYIDMDWVFVAMRVSPYSTAAGAPMVEYVSRGVTRPVLFRFPSEEPVYPMAFAPISGRPSKLQLYVVSESPLVCRDEPGIEWSVEVFGDLETDKLDIPDIVACYEGTVVRRDTTFFVTDIAERHLANVGEAVLTKLQATLEPDRVVDLVFESYTPFDDLESEDIARRYQAARYLGTPPNREAVTPLMEMIWRSDAALISQDDAEQYFWEIGSYPDRDVSSALRTLGRIGAPEAVEEMTRWARGDNSRCALAALESLGDLAPDIVTEISLEILSGVRRRNPFCEEERAMTMLARDWLIANAGPESGRALMDIVRRQYDETSWDSHNPRKPHLGVSALLAAASSGNERAQAMLFQAMKKVALEALAPGSPGASSRRGMVGNYPAALTLGAAILESEYGRRVGSPLEVVQEELAGRPTVRDMLFRNLGHDPNLGAPADGLRAVMLARLGALEDRDTALLANIWDRAFDRPRTMRVVMGGSYAGSDTVSYNIDATAAAYAMGLQGRTDDLLDCWREVSWDDRDLKGELALALSLTGDPEGAPAVLEYVRRVWNEAAADPALVPALGQVEPPPFTWPPNAPLDLRYRVERIHDYLVETAWEDVRDMTVETGLHPLLRTYWALDAMPWIESPTERFLEALRELRTLTDVEPIRVRIDWMIEHSELTLALLPAG